MMKKKCISVLLALCLALALLPAALAVDTLPITWLPEGVSIYAYGENTGNFLAQNTDTGNWYLYNVNGELVKDLGVWDFELLSWYGDVFHEGLAIVMNDDGKCGFIDESGTLVIPLAYDFAQDFEDGMAVVTDWTTNKSGAIDKQGNVVVPLVYDHVSNFSEGLAAVEKDGQWIGYVDKTGELALSLAEYVDGSGIPSGFHNGVAAVWKGRNAGLIDKTGQVVAPFEYNNAMDLSCDLICVEKDGKWGFIDHSGNVAIPLTLDLGSGAGSCNEFRDGVCNIWDWSEEAMYSEEVYDHYYINMYGEVISTRYEYAEPFSGGMAYASRDGQYYFIDTTGQEVIDLSALTAQAWDGELYGVEFSNPTFSHGLCVIGVGAEEGLRLGLMNEDGELVLPMEYSFIKVYGTIGYVDSPDGRSGIFLNPYAAGGDRPSAPALTATPTSSTVTVNGTPTAFDAYNIGGANYFKLRDLAFVLNGTAKQFGVDWDAAANAISLTSGAPYAAVGGEMTPGTGTTQTPVPTSSKILLNGTEIALEAYNIGGNNYFKLRDLGSAFDFGVDWDGANNTVVIDTSKGYTPD